eukprot:12419010-Karenia_brevis.AAC.1
MERLGAEDHPAREGGKRAREPAPSRNPREPKRTNRESNDGNERRDESSESQRPALRLVSRARDDGPRASSSALETPRPESWTEVTDKRKSKYSPSDYIARP